MGKQKRKKVGEVRKAMLKMRNSSTPWVSVVFTDVIFLTSINFILILNAIVLWVLITTLF